MPQIALDAHPIPSLAAALRADPAQTAFFDCEDGSKTTYGELVSLVDQIAEAIQSTPLQPGSTVAIVCRTPLATLTSMLATWQTGKIPVPLAEMPKGGERTRIFGQCQIGLTIRERPRDSSSVAKSSTCGEVRLPSEVLIVELAERETVEVNVPKAFEGLALVVYTSGTTGHAKGVMLSAEAMTWATESMAAVVNAQSGDEVLVPLSSSHLYGIIASCYLLRSRSAIYNCGIKSSGASLLNHIENFRLGGVLLQPQHVRTLIDIKGRAPIEGIRYVACGSGGISKPEMSVLADMFPRADHFYYYALSEAPRAVYTMNPHRSSSDEIPLGRPASGMQLTIADNNHSQGERLGEIVISGPAVAIGYMGEPEISRKTFIDGCFYTGDLGEDIDGDIFYRGRVTDLIVRGAIRLSPWKIESQLMTHLGRSDAVVGLVQVPETDEAILQVVLEGPLSDPERSLVAHISQPVATRLGVSFRVKSVDAFPRNPAGKIVRQLALSTPSE